MNPERAWVRSGLLNMRANTLATRRRPWSLDCFLAGALTGCAVTLMAVAVGLRVFTPWGAG